MREGLIYECMIDDFPGYGSQTTIGNVVFNTTGRPMSDSRLEHETNHADQWAIFGESFIPMYLSSQITTGRCNVFEWWARFQAGGYSKC
jgi:hypothetical protein